MTKELVLKDFTAKNNTNTTQYYNSICQTAHDISQMDKVRATSRDTILFADQISPADKEEFKAEEFEAQFNFSSDATGKSTFNAQ